MWEAYRAGTIPVGAVVAGESGEIVSRGRNRIYDVPHDGQLARSRLAHAELNALVGLAVDRRYEEFTLYSALEPCHLCLAAAFTARIGTITYAGSDPYAGAVGKLLPSVDHERNPVAAVGPLPGVEGLLPELLHVAHFLWRLPESNIVRFYRETRPEMVDAARELPPPDAEASLADAFAHARAAVMRSGGVGWVNRSR
jgi:tRNA(Arg) A34 adenosine deaminase TadA